METRLTQIKTILKEKNPEIYSEISPSGEFMVMEDKYGTRCLVYPYGGSIYLKGCDPINKSFYACYSNMYEFTGEELYKAVKIFDNGKRYNPNSSGRTFMQRFEDEGKKIFLDSKEDPECYVKYLKDDKSALFNRWDFSKNPADRKMKEAMMKGGVTIGGMSFSDNKVDLLKAWYHIGFMLRQEYDLGEELNNLLSYCNVTSKEDLKSIMELFKLEF